MTPTHLLYLEQNDLDVCQAKVQAISEENGRTAVVLDQTVFYAQGGGQPCDHGIIEGANSIIFKVDDVRFVEGIVKHFGTFYHGTFSVGDEVTCRIDQERRALMSRIHSAGHVIDMAVTALGFNWKPGKGFHFAEGPYIEYAGSLDEQDKDAVKTALEKECNLLIEKKVPVTFAFMTKEEMGSVCHFVPDYLPEGKPARVVLFGKYGIPCGGTHVKNLANIKHIGIRKLKSDGSTIRVSYEVGS